jgi:hypothetical protein
LSGAFIVLEQTNPSAAPIVRNAGESRISITISLLIVTIAGGALYHLV